MSIELNNDIKQRFERLAAIRAESKQNAARQEHRDGVRKWLTDPNGGAPGFATANRKATKNGYVFPAEFVANFPELSEMIDDSLFLREDSTQSREEQIASFAINAWKNVVATQNVADKDKAEIDVADRLEAIENFEQVKGICLTVAPTTTSNKAAIFAQLLQLL